MRTTDAGGQEVRSVSLQTYIATCGVFAAVIIAGAGYIVGQRSERTALADTMIQRAGEKDQAVREYAAGLFQRSEDDRTRLRERIGTLEGRVTLCCDGSKGGIR